MAQCKRHDCTREGVKEYRRADWTQGMPERYGARDASELWLHAVEFHTSCEMLRAEDRLSKLSALASMSDMGIQDRYVAGLWEKSMTTGLLWEVNFRPGQTNTNKIKITLPFKKQKAPSFSWASVDTPVVWRHKHWTARPEARITGCGSIPTDPNDPCGSVDGAWINVEGLLLKCEVSQTLAGAGGDRWQLAHFVCNDDRTIKTYPFVGDGALATVKSKGALELLRVRHAAKTRLRLLKKGLLGEKQRNPRLTRAFLTRNHFEYRRNVLGPKTTRGMAFVLCIRQRGDYDEMRGGMIFDRWDGLVLTRSMRYLGLFERIGCIRDLPSTMLDFNDPFYSVTIV
ncbi:hypothetical protein TrVFT333_001803 [Trichoderma virens FT-333]|nr:hypothetical protein TrVFT333_001803 [Trichoderma virens FT-333]